MREEDNILSIERFEGNTLELRREKRKKIASDLGKACMEREKERMMKIHEDEENDHMTL